MRLYINLLNFNSSKIAGVGYFMKRLFEQTNFDNLRFNEFDKIIVLHNKNLDVKKVFSISDNAKFKFKPVQGINGFMSRILYEQFLLPFFFWGKRGVYFSPTPIIPILSTLRKKRKLQFVCTIHDMIPFFLRKKYGRLRSLYIRIISVMSARLSNTVITVSDHSKSDIAKISKIDPNKIKIVYNFLPNTTFTPEKRTTPTLITICTIEPGKNLENTLRGFKIFLEKYNKKEYKYIVIGKNGWNYQHIYAEVENLKLGPNVYFTGYLSENAKQKYICECEALLYLSKYEGFGIPPLEAMYFGKPSLVSSSSSLPEVVGKAGLICENVDSPDSIADSIYELLNNRDIYIKEIPFQIQKFDPSEQERHFIDVLCQSTY